MTIEPLDKNLSGEQMKALTFYLLNGPYSCPDAIRDYAPLVKTVKRLFDDKENVFMAIKTETGLAGVFGLINIAKGHQAMFVSWFWNKGAVTPASIKNIRNFLTYCKDVLSLKRIYTETACERHERILGLIGFKIEGRFRNAFRWHGRLYSLIKMRIIGEL